MENNVIFPEAFKGKKPVKNEGEDLVGETELKAERMMKEHEERQKKAREEELREGPMIPKN